MHFVLVLVANTHNTNIEQQQCLLHFNSINKMSIQRPQRALNPQLTHDRQTKHNESNTISLLCHSGKFNFHL